MLKHAVATTYFGPVSTGRTRPCRIEAMDCQSSEYVELILKCSNSCFHGTSDLVREALGAQVARMLDLCVPDTFVVDLDDAFVQSVTDTHHKKIMTESCDKAFGSQIIPAVNVLPSIRKKIADDETHEAMAILSFDGACENSDRRRSNPNLLSNGKKNWLIDHELIWPTVYILGHRNVWTPGGLEFLASDDPHVFTSDLKGRGISVDQIKNKWSDLRLEDLRDYARSLPQEWDCAEVTEIALRQMENVKENIDDFFNEVERVLES